MLDAAPDPAIDPRQTVVAVVLAGGAGSRFTTTDGGHKLDAGLPATAVEPAETVARRALRHVAAAGIGPIVVVTGGWTPPPELRADFAAVTQPDLARAAGGAVSIRFVANPDWSLGQMTSVRIGLAEAERLGADRAVIGLADQPFVSADAWRSVAAGAGPIRVATYAGRRANPVALDRTTWPLLPDSGDEGARALMRIRPDLVREVACSGSPADIDTTEDLHRWQNN